MSASLILKSKMFAFSSILSVLVDLGMQMKPF